MTDRYERIRAALSQNPTPGPWIVTHELRECDATVCDPDTIRALLEERDALLADRDRLREALELMLEIHGVTQQYADAHIEIPQLWVDVSDLARAALAGENKA